MVGVSIYYFYFLNFIAIRIILPRKSYSRKNLRERGEMFMSIFHRGARFFRDCFNFPVRDYSRIRFSKYIGTGCRRGGREKSIFYSNTQCGSVSNPDFGVIVQKNPQCVEVPSGEAPQTDGVCAT